MYIKKSYFTLILIALTFSVWNTPQADYSQALNNAEQEERNKHQEAQTALDTLQDCQLLLSKFRIKYEVKQLKYSESAYEAAFNRTKSQIQATNTAINEYNKAYDAYLKALQAHNTSPSHSISPSGKHVPRAKKTWNVNDYLPSSPSGQVVYDIPLRALMSNRVFMGSLGCLVLLGIGCLLYLYLNRNRQVQ